MGAGELARAPMKSCFSVVQVVFITKGGLGEKQRCAPRALHGNADEDTSADCFRYWEIGRLGVSEKIIKFLQAS